MRGFCLSCDGDDLEQLWGTEGVGLLSIHLLLMTAILLQAVINNPTRFSQMAICEARTLATLRAHPHVTPSKTNFNSPQMAMKCADLGHLASAKSVHLKWVQALEEEMFRQGDLEKQRGYAVSPLMDRTKTGITKSQTGVSG